MKRKAIGLPFAIFIMVVLATIGVYSFYITSTTVRTVVEQDILNKMKLYASSAAELDILWLQGHKGRVENPSDFNVSFEENRYMFKLHNTPLRGREKDLKSETSDLNKTVVLIDVVGVANKDLVGQERRIAFRLVAKP
ncbi:MAG: hypothetical protein ACTTIC_05625 [Helicobacteraceae bacterium]